MLILNKYGVYWVQTLRCTTNFYTGHTSTLANRWTIVAYHYQMEVAERGMAGIKNIYIYFWRRKRDKTQDSSTESLGIQQVKP